MKAVTPQQMQEIDARCLKKHRIPGLVLMENAGKAVAQAAAEMAGIGLPGARSPVCLICGTGNNGGDGLAAARHLAAQGFPAEVFLVGTAGKLKGDTRVNANKLKASGIKLQEVASPKGLNALKRSLENSCLAIDAVFGTGFKGIPDKFCSQVVDILNQSGLPVLAVDIPSGVDGRTGACQGAGVRAAATVTMGLLKTGLLFHPGKAMAGAVSVADIGIPQAAVDEMKDAAEVPDECQAKGMLPRRPPDAHKGTCGTVLVLAGSIGMTGAAALTAISALRAGAGMVYLGIPESLNDIMESKLTEVITKPLPETRTRTLSVAGFDKIRNLLSKADVLAVGPGLSAHPETAELVGLVLSQTTMPAVIDADALNASAARPETLYDVKAPLILTPHYGEMSRLLRKDVSQIKADPMAAAQEAAASFCQTVVLKGAPTVIAQPKGGPWINPTGNAGMATAGSGDVLTGIMAGLLAQGLKTTEAARLGSYLHGLAGDLAAGETTQYSMLAGDILDFLPRAFARLSE
ncbi:MAG TPA: bifunctional ADP-dependent NAD(P)H-hydrate dehydratase/NAD(P)H-hydrate epimerase [candidate division Zixibacteria bacterium]|nr:bifunctional ADP-dependent NAD(P)H-hydrate dehydratase/NAD(P)H-hydrate epimerase [candidate division Zixibacteria bacterium]